MLRSQALRCGLTRRAIDGRLSRHEWAPAYEGLYRLAAVAQTWEQRVHAAMLWSSGAASHRTAARLWRLDLEVPDDAPIEVVTRMMRRHEAPEVIVHRSSVIAREDLTEREGIRVTRLGTTLVHLAQVLDAAALEVAVDSALRTRDGLLDWMSKWLAPRATRGMHGLPALKHLVRVRAQGSFDSKLEVLLKQLMDRRGVPPPTHVHFDIHEPFPMNLDFVWLPQRVALQGYGMKDHGKRKRFDLDLTQIRELAARGWTVLPATWTDATKKEEALAANIIRALRASGVPTGSNTPALLFRPYQHELALK